MLHEIGTVLAQRYEILASIGQGGMGAVYRGKDRMRNRVVAIKQMRDDDSSGFDNPQMRARFEQEWQILKKLEHPRIPTMYDAFQQDDSDYFVMEFVEGESLDVKLNQLRAADRRFPEILLLEYALQILDVLNYMHGLIPPLLHRDIKPQNIIVRYDNGELVLVDFGLAREGSSNTTKTMVGTLGYAPLEQVKGHPEPRSDLYALGATMWHILTGQPPNPFDIAPIESIRSDVHPALAEVVNRACQDLPSKRFANATKMEIAARQVLSVMQGGAPEVAPPLPVEDDEDAIRVTSVTVPPMPASVFIFRVGFAGLLAAMAFFGILKIREHHSQASTANTTADQQSAPGKVATAPTVNQAPGQADSYALQPAGGLAMRPAQPAEVASLKDFLPGWTLAALAGNFSKDGDLVSDASSGAVILLGHQAPITLQSLSFRIFRMKPQASLQVQIRDGKGNVKLGFLSIYERGKYLNALMLPGQGSPTKPVILPAEQSSQNLSIRIFQAPTGVSLQVADGGDQNFPTLQGAKLENVQIIQFVVPPANVAQQVQIQGVTVAGS